MAKTEFFKEIYSKLLPHWDVYQKLHPVTADTDLEAVRRRAHGESAAKVALEIYCSESRVHSATKRIKNFLSEELPVYTRDIRGEFYIHRALALQVRNLSLAAHKLYYLLVYSYQQYEPYAKGKWVHEVLPGLRNKKQRDKAIAELNALSLCPYGEKESVVKIFDFVTYERGKYIFEFTSEALPYYDMGYAILNMLEANME